MIGFIFYNKKSKDNFTNINLPEGVTIQLPKDWTILANQQRVAIDSAVKGIEPDLHSDYHFAANYYGNTGKTEALVNIRYYPDQYITQTEVSSLTEDDIVEIDAELRGAMEKAGRIAGYSVINWNGTKRTTINGVLALVTEYTRTPLNNGVFCVRIVRVLNKEKSYSLTVSYKLSEQALRQATDNIIASMMQL